MIELLKSGGCNIESAVVVLSRWCLQLACTGGWLNGLASGRAGRPLLELENFVRGLVRHLPHF
jgi:hypothetical protein